MLNDPSGAMDVEIPLFHLENEVMRSDTQISTGRYDLAVHEDGEQFMADT